jgi:hypothetical protein
VPAILWTCPLIEAFSVLYMLQGQVRPYISYNSLFYLTLHWPLSLTRPWILLNIFPSKILMTFSDFFERNCILCGNYLWACFRHQAE